MRSVAESASETICVSIERLVDDAVARQFVMWPELERSFSATQRTRMREDTRYHLEFFASALWFSEPAILDDYAVWCKTLFANLNLPSEWIEGSWLRIAETLDAALPSEEAAATRTAIEDAIVTLKAASTASSSFLAPGAPLGELARNYLITILDGDRADAVRLVIDAANSGVSARDIYLRIFQPTQREMGRLWLLNEVSVAEEHYVTAVTQVAMARLHERSALPATTGMTLVAASVGSELHDLGIHMVADVFELDGWNTRYLGANTPRSAVLEAVRATRSDVLALSATIASHVTEVAEIIDDLRADESTAHVKVLVGGYPFNVAPDLWRRVGADGYAADAETAPQIAARLAAQSA
ncbi:MAG: cobalamin-dependent protein [Coriobacteriia bacterium]|nr:cobalamin-dependent protein [Coriobacteriia bacterium]